MTDKEYLLKLCAFMRELNRIDPMNQFMASQRDELFDAIRLLNFQWNHGQRWRHWHYIFKLLILCALLAFVIYTIVC